MGTSEVVKVIGSRSLDFIARERELVEKDAMALLSGLNDNVEGLRVLEVNTFGYESAAWAEMRFREALAAKEVGTMVNEDVARAVQVFQEHGTRAVMDIEMLRSWVNLHVPKCETGNNFGVEVQELVIKYLKAAQDEIAANLSKLPEYYKSRGEIVARFGKEEFKETETLEFDEKKDTFTTGQDAKMEKLQSSKSTTKSLQKQLRQNEDFVTYTVQLDMDW
eukprot:CAMPEP_0184686674 /NCGR_PEP_ID=MMETSP0312-20130426/23530_1 /TAXON_ID=31354 /ORGANISM="Compsopogon coeruleus, Strain SAG 36.94" /LENGTH=220 /DNA_ID=CAMNT_0027142029 /DNA_START=143 /DNA_END=802 /DNA_ORIENTATION=+